MTKQVVLCITDCTERVDTNSRLCMKNLIAPGMSQPDGLPEMFAADHWPCAVANRMLLMEPPM